MRQVKVSVLIPTYNRPEWLPEKLSRQLPLFDTDVECGFSFGNVVFMDNGVRTGPAVTAERLPSGWILGALATDMFIHPSTDRAVPGSARRIARRTIARHHTTLARMHLRAGETAEARQHLRAAVRLNPFSRSAWLSGIQSLRPGAHA